MTLLCAGRLRPAASLLAFFIFGGPRELVGQELQIGIIDAYGLNRVSATEVRQALTFKEGDTISLGDGTNPAWLAESEKRLSLLPAIVHARMNMVCCDQGHAIIFVGVEERGATTVRFRAAPQGAVRLAPDILKAGDDLSDALIPAMRAGDDAEDRSQGHALNHAPAMRAVQERFVTYAERDLPRLRRVLHDSSDARHRALAAMVLGYVAAKQAVVNDLVYAMSDPAEDVRNNAMRALLVFTEAMPGVVRPTPRVPYQPFVVLLNSPVWKDRNKASLALEVLSKGREPHLLATLHKEALTSLVEMARWKSKGHAMAAFMILGRIAGHLDEDTEAAWRRDELEVVVRAALSRGQ